MKIGPATIVAQDREPIATEVDDEVVMLSARAESYFGLGEVGSEIWNIIARPHSVADICSQLVRKYDIDRESCEREVVAFLTQLLDHRLLRVIDEGEARQ